jgi:Zn-dependent M16 (insulinase) family peptidase
MGEELGQLTERQAARLTASFDNGRRRQCAALTARVLAYQKSPPAPEALASLPRLDKKDLPAKNRMVTTEKGSIAGAAVYAHPMFTGGIGYLDIGFSLEHIPMELLEYFPLYSHMISRCGAANSSVAQMAIRTSLNTGGIGCSDFCAVRPGSSGEVVLKAMFHGKALAGRFDAMADIFIDLFREPVLRDPKLIHDSLLEMRNGFNSAVVHNGHIFASTHAASRLSKSRYIVELLDGISQLRFLDALVRRNETGAIAVNLERLHRYIVEPGGCFVSVTADSPRTFFPSVQRCVESLESSGNKAAPVLFPSFTAGKPTGVEVSSSVNFVARAWPLGGVESSMTGGLQVIAKCLSTGYLWEKVRVEGGAYGGKAFANSSHPVFMCASYRDPNLVSTLDHFQKALDYVASGLPADEVDQSIIGAIGIIDSPHMPHAQGLGETIALVCGRTPEYRQEIREAVLTATQKSLAECAEKLNDIAETAVTVLGSGPAFEKASSEGLRLIVEPLVK